VEVIKIEEEIILPIAEVEMKEPIISNEDFKLLKIQSNEVAVEQNKFESIHLL